MTYDEQEGLFDPRTIGQEFEADLKAKEEADMPMLEASALEPIEEDLPTIPSSEVELIEDEEEEETPKKETFVHIQTQPPRAKPVDPNVTFGTVDPENKQALETIASKIFDRARTNPLLNISDAERQAGGYTLSSTNDPKDHPLFRMIADIEMMEEMKNIALTLRKAEFGKKVPSVGNAEMRAVQYFVKRLNDALTVYKKIKPSEVKVLLESRTKVRNERVILQAVVDYVMNHYLTKEEVAKLEAPVRAKQRNQAREADAPHVATLPLVRESFKSKFVDDWLQDSERSVFVEHVFAILHSRIELPAGNADLMLQAEAVRELKQAAQKVQEKVQMKRTGTD